MDLENENEYFLLTSTIRFHSPHKCGASCVIRGLNLVLVANIKVSPAVDSYFCGRMTTDPSQDLQQRWWNFEAELVERFGKKPDMDAILYLIGLQELQMFAEKITKEQKQDLMHVAVCTILSPGGYYIMEGKDEDGWPHFKQLKPLPSLQLKEQEDFIKDHVLLYFDQQNHTDL